MALPSLLQSDFHRLRMEDAYQIGGIHFHAEAAMPAVDVDFRQFQNAFFAQTGAKDSRAATHSLTGKHQMRLHSDSVMDAQARCRPAKGGRGRGHPFN